MYRYAVTIAISLILLTVPCYGMEKGTDQEDLIVRKFFEQTGINLDGFTQAMMQQEAVRELQQSGGDESNGYYMLVKEVSEEFGNGFLPVEGNVILEKIRNDPKIRSLVVNAVTKTKEMNDAWLNVRLEAITTYFKEAEFYFNMIKRSEGEPDCEYRKRFLAANKEVNSRHPLNRKFIRSTKEAVSFILQFARDSVKEVCPVLRDNYTFGPNYRIKYKQD